MTNYAKAREDFMERTKNRLQGVDEVGHARAAELAGVTSASLHQLNHLGRGPVCFRRGPRLVYPVTQLLEWLEGRLQPRGGRPSKTRTRAAKGPKRRRKKV